MYNNLYKMVQITSFVPDSTDSSKVAITFSGLPELTPDYPSNTINLFCPKGSSNDEKFIDQNDLDNNGTYKLDLNYFFYPWDDVSNITKDDFTVTIESLICNGVSFYDTYNILEIYYYLINQLNIKGLIRNKDYLQIVNVMPNKQYDIVVMTFDKLYSLSTRIDTSNVKGSGRYNIGEFYYLINEGDFLPTSPNVTKPFSLQYYKDKMNDMNCPIYIYIQVFLVLLLSQVHQQ